MAADAYERFARLRRFTCVKPSSFEVGVSGRSGGGSVGGGVCTVGTVAGGREGGSRLAGGGGGGGICRLSSASILLRTPEREDSTLEDRDSKRAITGSAGAVLTAELLVMFVGVGALHARGAGEGDGSLRRRGGGLS